MFRPEHNIICPFDKFHTILVAILELLGFLYARNKPCISTDTYMPKYMVIHRNVQFVRVI